MIRVLFVCHGKCADNHGRECFYAQGKNAGLSDQFLIPILQQVQRRLGIHLTEEQ